MGQREAVAKYYATQKANSLTSTFSALRESRVKQERESELFDLRKKQGELKLKAMELDPAIDPGLVAIKKRSLKLGLEQEKNKLDIAQKQLDYQLADTATQMGAIGEKVKHINRMSQENPEMYGDMMIIPNFETGQVELQPRTASSMVAESTIKKNQAAMTKDMIDSALKLSTDSMGVVDEEKFQNSLQNLKSGGTMGAVSSPATKKPIQYAKGDKVKANGKTYEYLGNDEWEEQ